MSSKHLPPYRMIFGKALNEHRSCQWSFWAYWSTTSSYNNCTKYDIMFKGLIQLMANMKLLCFTDKDLLVAIRHSNPPNTRFGIDQMCRILLLQPHILPASTKYTKLCTLGIDVLNYSMGVSIHHRLRNCLRNPSSSCLGKSDVVFTILHQVVTVWRSLRHQRLYSWRNSYCVTASFGNILCFPSVNGNADQRLRSGHFKWWVLVVRLA